MNIETINYISMIAGMAASRVEARATLKATKAWLADCVTEDATPFVNHEGVDFAVVEARFPRIFAVNTKWGFLNLCNELVNVMQKKREENATAARVEWTIKRAANQGLTVTAADVLATSVAQADIYFNVNRAVEELAEQASAKPVTRESVKDAVEVYAMYATTNDVIFDVACMPHRIEKVEQTITGTALTFDNRTEHYEAGETVLVLECAAKLMQAAFYAGNDYGARRAIVEACHAEAIAINDAIDTPARRHKARSTTVKAISASDGITTYRIHLDNGRVYLYAVGADFAQIKMPGGKLKETRSPYTLERLKAAISQA